MGPPSSSRAQASDPRDFQKGAKGATEPYDFSARCVNAQDPHIYSSPEPSTFPVFGFTRCAWAHARHVTWT